MEEYESKRTKDVDANDVSIEIKDCSFSWGFRVKDDQKYNARGKVQIDVDDKPVIKNLNFHLKKNDHMIVVG